MAVPRHRASTTAVQRELASPPSTNGSCGCRFLDDTRTPLAPGSRPPAVPASSGNPQDVPFEGFDFTRPQDPAKSAKDAFARAVKDAPPPPGEDKQALEAWFNRYIRPQMEALGHQIHWVQGDKMSFTSQQGTFTVDYLRGAGAPGWAVAWQVEGSGGGSNGAGAAPGGVPAMVQAFMDRLTELVSADADRDEMEAAIRQAAEETGVRYDEVYKESIRLPGLGWIDLVQGYGGANPTWQWLSR